MARICLQITDKSPLSISPKMEQWGRVMQEGISVLAQILEAVQWLKENNLTNSG